jgi:chaperonin GroEL (HSP60 family)
MTLIPCGTDKHIVDKQKANMSNSGVTIMKLLEMEHQVVKTLGNIVEYYKMDGTRQ